MTLAVVIPNYNYGRFLAECVASLCEVRIPPGWKLSVVFVDDVSTDDSVAVWEQERAKLHAAGIPTSTVIRQTNGGTAAALNSGIQVADSEWVMPLASDDRIMPHALEELAARLAENPKASVVPFGYTAFGVVSDGSRAATGDRLYRKHGDGSGRAYVEAFNRGERISTGCSPFRRVWWERFGFPEHLRKSEDSAFWMRIAAKGACFEPSKRPCVWVRFHPNRKSFDHKNHPGRDERVQQIRALMREPEPVDFLASERHFVDHLVPLWHALPVPLRGRFLVPASLLGYAQRWGVRAVSYGVKLSDSLLQLSLGTGPVVTAASGNQAQVAQAGRVSIFSEHGAGQSYRNRHSSYAGYPGRRNVALFLVPGPHAAARNRRAYPNTPIVEVGAPKLDAWHRREITPPKNTTPPADRLSAAEWGGTGQKPVVAISFHWDCRVCPETRSAFNHFEPALKELATADDFTLIGHGHPRIIEQLRPVYEKLGIEVVEDFDDVLRRADCYAVDNSSTLFEFASTGRPVVVLNAPWYRRDVRHGLRFWEAATVGVQVERPQDLAAGIRQALDDSPVQQQAREAALRLVYTHRDGRAAQRAAQAIERVTRQLATGQQPNVFRAPSVPPRLGGGETDGALKLNGHSTPSPMSAVQMTALASFRNRVKARNLSRPNEEGRIFLGDRFEALDENYARDLERKRLAVRNEKPQGAPAQAKPTTPQATPKPTAPATPKPNVPAVEKVVDTFDDLTRDELYERAKALDIPGRSKMDREELIAAIATKREVTSRPEDADA